MASIRVLDDGAPPIVEKGRETPFKQGEFYVFDVEDDVVLKDGFADYKHALGHAIARADHEIGPLLGPRWRNRYGHAMDKTIGRSIMFTIEPTIYSKYGGINLEQEVLVNEEGRVERISHPQEELMVV